MSMYDDVEPNPDDYDHIRRRKTKPTMNVEAIPEEVDMTKKYVKVAFSWKGDKLLGKAYTYDTEHVYSRGTTLVVGSVESPQLVRVVCMTEAPEFICKSIQGRVSWV